MAQELNDLKLCALLQVCYGMTWGYIYDIIHCGPHPQLIPSTFRVGTVAELHRCTIISSLMAWTCIWAVGNRYLALVCLQCSSNNFLFPFNYGPLWVNKSDGCALSWRLWRLDTYICQYRGLHKRALESLGPFDMMTRGNDAGWFALYRKVWAYTSQTEIHLTKIKSFCVKAK